MAAFEWETVSEPGLEGPPPSFSTDRGLTLAGPAEATGPADWRRSLAAAIRDPDELLDRLGLGDEWRSGARAGAALFPVVVPHSYLARMEPGDPFDPLLRQVLPLGAELESPPGFAADAVGDAEARTAPGLLHKYHGRTLLIAARECAVHCRYCFRRHYPYAEEPASLDDWQPAFDALAADETIHEVILSGGDPLVLTDRRLASLIGRVEQIPHVQRLRIHTRLPIVLPERVTAELLQILRATRLTPIIVVHANHPQEVVADCAAALQQLVRSGVTTLNQAVLLRGINDHADTLADLSERLINRGVIPYYLHQLDRVSGAAHFELSAARGREIVAQLRSRLPGYAVPQYVQEIAGADSKSPLGG
jgi:EF-P beta-lysylation protein EpmB